MQWTVGQLSSKLFVRGFVVKNHDCRAIETLRTVFEKGSLATYINNFHNISLTVPDLYEMQTQYHFLSGLKPFLAYKAKWASCMTFDSAIHVSMLSEGANQEGPLKVRGR